MDLEISEIRLEHLDDALAFAQQANCEVPREHVRPQLSLLVRHDGKTVGAALCVEARPGDVTLEIALADDHDEPRLARQLIDKALLKVRAAGMHKCRIRTRGRAETDGLWATVNWLECMRQSDAA